MVPLNYHVRDYVTTTNVMQASGQITYVAEPKTGMGLRIETERLALGLSQAALGKAAGGLSQSAIANYETGIRSSPRELLAIAEALNVQPQWLKSGRGPKRPGQTSAVAKVVDIGGHPLRRVSESQWTFLQVFGELPEEEQKKLLDSIRKRVEKVRRIVSDYLHQSPAAIARSAQAADPA